MYAVEGLRARPMNQALDIFSIPTSVDWTVREAH